MTDQAIHRIGHGYDLHRLEAGRPLILAGVTVPYEKGLAGHSDADVVLHAVTDALLGAAGLEDIGQLFPDTDPRFKGADSGLLLKEALSRVRRAGFEPVCVDATIIAQQPKLSPFKAAMRASLAQLLEMPADRVNLKAKTNEKMGPEGEGLAISCHAVAGLFYRERLRE